MAVSLLPIVLLSIARISPVLSAVPRPGTLDDATLFPFAGFAPRWYAEGTPAVPAQPVSPNPRHLLNGFGARDVSMCDPGSHTCAEANAPGTCCPDDRYCYLDQDWKAQCCPLGLKCNGSRCDSDHLYCNTTISTTIPVTSSATGRGGDDTVTSFVSVRTSAGCCNRACSTDAFSCEAAFGGHCCRYGFKCAATSECVQNLAQSTNIGPSTTVPGIAPGCTATSQFSCTDGGGCCNTGSICTSQIIGAATSKVCAPDPAFSSSGGLSSGAKAGIGVGVAVGAAIIIGALTWFCIRRRQKSSGTTGTNASAHEMRQSTGAAGGQGEDAGDSLLVGPNTPHTYHYSDARAGPYTDREGEGPSPPHPSLATPPPAASPPNDGGRFASSMPYHPDHIMRPVEIGDAETHEVGTRSKSGHIEEMPTHDRDSPEGLFELVGSLPEPSPLISEEMEVNPIDKVHR